MTITKDEYFKMRKRILDFISGNELERRVRFGVLYPDIGEPCECCGTDVPGQRVAAEFKLKDSDTKKVFLVCDRCESFLSTNRLSDDEMEEIGL